MTRDTDHSDAYTRRRFLAATGTAAAVAVAGTGSAAAQTTEDAPEGFFADDTLGSRILMSGAFIRGFVGGAISEVMPDDGVSIDDHVDAAVTEFDSKTDDWLAYVNSRGLGGSDRQTLRLTFELKGSERDRYIVANWDGSEYSSVAIETEFSGEPDHTATLRDRAVKNAADELETLHEEYIGPDKDIPKSHASKLAGRYHVGTANAHVSSSLLGGG